MKSARKIILSVLLTFIGSAILFTFWVQEIQYSLPTPIPAQHKIIPIGSIVNSDNYFSKGTLKLLHFYNPSCPCSKFNSDHINYLFSKYGKEISFFVVTEKEMEKATKDFDFAVIHDENGKLADICGVYATPQAVLLDEKNQIYYRGNYNKERYCTDKNSNFAEIAIIHLLQGYKSKKDSTLVTRTYGCQLSSDIKNTKYE
jgi:hypothetical protein